MKLLSGEVKSLLDKLYNLRGEDSVILTKINKEREEAIETQERTKNEKEVLTKEIEKLNNEENILADQGNKLMEVLNTINRSEFSLVLEKLGIDFEPENINSQVHRLLPETIENVVLENKKATEKLESIEEEMSNSATLVEELGLRKDEAISNQNKLNEYFNLALHGNINITRDEITNLLSKFDFTEAEQREAAKLLMFPEDGLYDYDESVRNGENTSGKSMADIFSEAKATVDEEKEELVNIDSEEEKKSEEIVEDNEPKEDKKDKLFDASIVDEVYAKSIDDEKSNEEEPVLEPTEEEEIVDIVPEEKEEEPVLNEATIDTDEVVEETKEEANTDKDNIINTLTELGIDINSIDENELAKLMAKYDEDLVKGNMEVLKTNNVDLKILNKYVTLLVDKELKDKIAKLLEIGKEIEDINLMPSILSKYDLKGLINTINVLQISGLDPKKVPLMAF